MVNQDTPKEAELLERTTTWRMSAEASTSLLAIGVYMHSVERLDCRHLC